MAHQPTVHDFILVLQTYFPPDLPVSNAMHILASMEATSAMLHLHHNQRRDARQPAHTAWLKHFRDVLRRTFRGLSDGEQFRAESAEELAEQNPHVERLYGDLPQLFEFLGMGENNEREPAPLFPEAYPLLITSRTNCELCGEDIQRRTLRLDKERGLQIITLLDENLRWTRAELCVANCSQCHALFYPDKIVFNQQPGNNRKQRLEDNPTYICISKSGVWAHRRVALMQEHVMQCFAGGWSSFADWINAVSQSRSEHTCTMTARQAKRLFVEHFARRLLSVHSPHPPFISPAHAATDDLAAAVRIVIGENGGVIPGALGHGCKDCAHQKRYRADLIAEGIPLAAGHAAEVVGIPGVPGVELNEVRASDVLL